MRSLFFQRWLVHGQRGSHNRVACGGYQILVGHKTLKHSSSAGDGVLAKLKCVIHARLPSVLSLRKRDRGPVQGDNNDEHDSLLHRGPSLRSTAMSISPGVIRGPRDYGSPGTESIEAAHVATGQTLPRHLVGCAAAVALKAATPVVRHRGRSGSFTSFRVSASGFRLSPDSGHITALQPTAHHRT